MQEFITVPTYLIRELPGDKLCALMDILSMADENGEVCVKQRMLMERWGWGNTKVRNFIDFLEQEGYAQTKNKPKTNQKQTKVLLVNTRFFPMSQTKNKPKTNQKQTTENRRLTIKRPEAEKMISDAWNELSDYGINPIPEDGISDVQYQKISVIAKRYGVEDLLKTIQKIKCSDFLQGRSNIDWKITFNWFIRPEKYEKVRSGEYDGRASNTYENQTAKMLEQHYDMVAEFVKEMEEKENDIERI